MAAPGDFVSPEKGTFGAGYSGLNLLAEFPPDEVNLDIHLVRDIESKGPRQALVRAVIQACGDLGIDVITECVESDAEYRWFKRAGVTLFQGYLFARPGFETLPAAASVTPAHLSDDSTG